MRFKEFVEAKWKNCCFGVGYLCEKMLKGGYLEHYQILAFVDNDKKKWGECISGKSVQEPIIGLNLDYDKVLIAIMDYCEIKKQLINDFGINENKIMCIKDVFDEIKNKKLNR